MSKHSIENGGEMGNLYYGDNLPILQNGIADDSVDLIYLDPPFNSNATYNQLFKEPTGEHSAAQIEAFDDTWHWNDSAEQAFDEVLKSSNGAAAEMLRAMRAFLGENDMMAYLTMMAVRMLELHRVLKPTGSLYLHCDPTASHYLKILLDAVFGKKNFRNEIVWRRTGAHNSAHRFGPIHDVILFYAASDSYEHQNVFTPYLRGHIKNYFKKKDERGHYWTNSIHGKGVTKDGVSGKPWRGYNPTDFGRHWAVPSELVLALGIDPDLPQHAKLNALYDAGVIELPKNGLPTYRQYLQNSKGQLLQDIWAYQPHTKNCLHGTEDGIDQDVRWIPPRDKKERLGYPTQKPVALLERILKASSNQGDTVLDPFCGCGTSIHAAEKLGRNWIGIDVTHLAIGLIEKRLKDAFEGIKFQTHGTPQDFAGAEALADADKHEFEKWALSLLEAQPGNQGKKGADGGFDGIKYFGEPAKRAIISVKGGKNVGVGMVRDLDSVVKRENADVGILLTLTEPTKNMVTEAAAVGRFELDQFAPVPRLQIVTIETALELRERAIELPLIRSDTFKRAQKEGDSSKQDEMDV